MVNDLHVKKTSLILVGLGEVLFDVFEDGTATLGGAPLNVAVHAHQLACALDVGEGVVVSRVGADAAGARIRGSLLEREMTTEYLQVDAVHPTGTVSVVMRDGEPGYQIEANAAWDFLEADEAVLQLAMRCDAVCFGSLAQRSIRSREAVRAFVGKAGRAVRLYDVNLRCNTFTNEPGYSPEIIEASCELATIMKLNCAELRELCALFDIASPGFEDEVDVDATALSLLRRFRVAALIVTRGAKGTTWYTESGQFKGQLVPARLSEVHPVGAGDACSAGILLGSVLGWHPDDAVDLANRMGTWVASQRAATPTLPESIPGFARELMYRGGSLGQIA